MPRGALNSPCSAHPAVGQFIGDPLPLASCELCPYGEKRQMRKVSVFPCFSYCKGVNSPEQEETAAARDIGRVVAMIQRTTREAAHMQ